MVGTICRIREREGEAVGIRLDDVPKVQVSPLGTSVFQNLAIYFPKPTLRNLPDETFMENKKLHKLVFQDFPPKLQHNSLEGLNNLGIMKFWGCNMTSLPDGIFENTPSLKEFTWEEHFCQQEKPVLSNHMFKGTQLVKFTYSQEEK